MRGIWEMYSTMIPLRFLYILIKVFVSRNPNGCKKMNDRARELDKIAYEQTATYDMVESGSY